MASSFGWLDFSDRDRQRSMDVVDLFHEENTRDELGLGVIRDAFADRLFPGTSTIQTRVRYFILLPWLFGMMRPEEYLRRAIRKAKSPAARKTAPVSRRRR